MRPAYHRDPSPRSRGSGRCIRRLVAAIGLAATLPAALAVASPPVQAPRELLGLVPADAAVVLIIDDLRGHTRDFLASRLATELRELPAFQAALRSPEFAAFERVREQIEDYFEATAGDVLDKILGDSLVLALQIPAEPAPDPSRARGLLLLRAADSALLTRLIDQINQTQKRDGEIAGLRHLKRGEVPYDVRQFHDPNRPSEAYFLLPDGTFAITNSEQLLQSVIDRISPLRPINEPTAEVPADSAGSARRASFGPILKRLPERAVAKLLVDPRVLEGILRGLPRPVDQEELRARWALERGLKALESAGGALVIRDGRIALHAAQIFERGEFSAVADFWGGPAATASTLIDRAPDTAVAMGSFQVNVPALYQGVLSLFPAHSQAQLRQLETVLTGVLLGQDFRRQVLPALGPRIVAVLEAPPAAGPGGDLARTEGELSVLPVVLAIQLTERGAAAEAGSASVPVSTALENGLRTLLALAAMDEKRGQDAVRAVMRDFGGVAVHSLEPPIPFAYAVDRASGQVVLGTSFQAVGRYLESATNPIAGDRFQQLRQVAAPRAASFVCLDLAKVPALIKDHRQRLVEFLRIRQNRSAEQISQDLDQIAALAGLFEAAYAALEVDPQSASWNQTVGLLGRGAGSELSPSEP